MRGCARIGNPITYLTVTLTSQEIFSGADPAPSSSRLPRILVVDDDAGSAAAIAHALRAREFEVVVAPDYRLALEELESPRRLDLLISDIVMPQRVNGLALSRMARMRRPDLKVIYVTAYDIPGAEREALGPVLRKPVDEENLVSEVRRMLAGV
jgi:CheY-like chemotaxis protein